MNATVVGVGIALVAASLALAVDVQFSLPGPRLNISPSIPVGMYWFTPQRSGFRVGETVVACFDGADAAYMRRVSDLGPGSCPSGIEPAAKVLAAAAPDVVTFAREGVRVNGELWPQSRAVPPARPLLGTITLAPGQVLLMGRHPLSADGRLLGITPDRVLIGTWRPLVVL